MNASFITSRPGLIYFDVTITQTNKSYPLNFFFLPFVPTFDITAAPTYFTFAIPIIYYLCSIIFVSLFSPRILYFNLNICIREILNGLFCKQ